MPTHDLSAELNNYNLYRELIERQIQKEVEFSDRKTRELYDPAKYILSLGGKRIRPLLVLIAADLFDGDVQSALPSAVAIEVFHNFTLVHDDIMDNAPVRRGFPTVHEKWGLPAAILSGDAMLVVAYEILIKSAPEKVPALLKVFNQKALEVCEGQQLDMIFEKSSNTSVASYLEMIRLKTAALLGGAMKMGGIVAGGREEDLNHIESFAENLGIAFQLQDDVLDIYGNAEKTGKRSGGDIISNKKTFLLLKALELSNSYMKEELRNWISASSFREDEKVKAVSDIFTFLNVRQLAEKEMDRHYNLAIESLEKIPCDKAKKEQLISLASSLMNRES